MTSIFSSFLTKIAPLAVKAKKSPNSRAAISLWQRIFGDREDEIEQLKVWMEALKEDEESSLQHKDYPTPTAPVASTTARQQLYDFMNETRFKAREGLNSRTTTSPAAQPWRSPFANTAPARPTPREAPVEEDLRVPVSLGDPNMIHLAQ